MVLYGPIGIKILSCLMAPFYHNQGGGVERPEGAKSRDFAEKTALFRV